MLILYRFVVNTTLGSFHYSDPLCMLNRDLVRVKHMIDGVEEILRFTQGKYCVDYGSK